MAEDLRKCTNGDGRPLSRFPAHDLRRSGTALSEADLEVSRCQDGRADRKGPSYGENPGQEAALYELVGGNLILGGAASSTRTSGLVSAIREEDMLQEGKHPGKTNLTDLDNGLNIMKYLMGKPAAAILKHNNPCGVAYGATLAEAYRRSNRADRIAAFGGCLVLNRPVERKRRPSSPRTTWR